MYFENIQLENFKNFRKAFASFHPGVNCITGPNGSGKTNLIDAIYYVSHSKSAFNYKDQQLINHTQTHFVVRSSIDLQKEKKQVHIGFTPGRKKHIKIDTRVLEKTSELIGRFPCVLIAPSDTDIIEGGSENRRKFFDQIISLLDPHYLKALVRYHKALKRRNIILKNFQERANPDPALIAPYDQILTETGLSILQKRQDFIEVNKNKLLEYHNQLTELPDKLEVIYSPRNDTENLKNHFKNNLKQDIAAGRTTAGIHLDDFEFTLDSFPIKTYGSQGQKKTAVIATKMILFRSLQEEKEKIPVLLLDDIFDKLDDHRIDKLINFVSSEGFGQIFITDARPERSRRFLQERDIEFNEIQVDSNALNDE